MRLGAGLFALAAACALARAADAQPTAVPTPAGAGAVSPSDQTAVKPGLPDERANRTVPLGTAPPTPAPLPAPGEAARPAPSPAPTPAAGTGEADAPGRSEPRIGPSPAAAGSVHRKPSVSGGRPVTVTKEVPYTVVLYEPGKSLTLRRPEGTLVSFPLSRKAEVPKGLAPGASVTIRTRTEGGKKVVARVREATETPVLTNVN